MAVRHVGGKDNRSKYERDKKTDSQEWTKEHRMHRSVCCRYVETHFEAMIVAAAFRNPQNDVVWSVICMSRRG
jgi:hypothetical protein